MSRYTNYNERDRQPHSAGDTGFVGVNMRLDPTQLPAGYVADALNMRFNKGIAETRPGIAFPVWANSKIVTTVTTPPPPQSYHFTSLDVGGGVFKFTSTSNVRGLSLGQILTVTAVTGPPMLVGVFAGLWEVEAIISDFVVQMRTPDRIVGIAVGVYAIDATGLPGGGGGPIISSGAGVVPWGTLRGIGVFDDPTTRKQYLIIANSNGVWYTSPNNIAYSIPLPTGVTLTGPVTFTQAFDTLIMHRGPDLSALAMTNIPAGFTEVVTSPQGDGTDTIPNADRSLYFQNRLFIPFGNDEVAVSDIGDYTRYLPVLSAFQINVGSSDKLVNIAKFNDVTLIAFKERSIYAVRGVYGDLNAIQLDEITNLFGLVGPKTVAHVGNDLYFLSQLGVMSITQTQQNQLQGVTTPLSEPIQPLINRINWKYATTSVAAYWDNKYYLAVPLDDAELLGIERAPTGAVIGNSTLDIPLTVGAKYRWSPGTGISADSDLFNGVQLGGVTRAGAVATFSTFSGNAHGFVSGQSVTMTGFNNAAYNITATITVTNPHQFTYPVGGAPPTPDPNTGTATLQGGGHYTGGTDFVAVTALVTIVNVSGTVSSSVREVTSGVNNAILVYDLMNQAWSGYDQSDGLSVSDLFIVRYASRERLFCSSVDGFIRMLEEGLEDQLANPYTDLVVVNTNVDPSDTFQINAGTLVGTNTGSSSDSATQIGTGAPDTPTIIQNLFTDPTFDYGYYAGAEVTGWTAPNTIPVKTATGVRFYATNGLIPTATLTISDFTPWLKAVSSTVQQITCRLRSRMYEGNNLEDYRFGWISFDFQTWNPKYTVRMIMPGENEVYTQVTDRTKNRTRWYKPFNSQPFDPANPDGRFLDKFREDYSILLGNGGTTGEATQIALYTTAGGVPTDLHQSVKETYKVKVPGAGAQLEMSNTQGRIRIYTLSTESQIRNTKAIPEA
jgi:hypothetical protein